MEVLVTQSCPMGYSPPGSSVMEFSRQEYWSGLLFPSPGYLPNLGIESGSPELQADSLPSEPPGMIWFYDELAFDYVDHNKPESS